MNHTAKCYGVGYDQKEGTAHTIQLSNFWYWNNQRPQKNLGVTLSLFWYYLKNK